MTFEEFAKKNLVKNGLFESQADKVISRAKADTDKLLGDYMARRWNDNLEAYPPPTGGGLLDVNENDCVPLDFREHPGGVVRVVVRLTPVVVQVVKYGP